MAEPNLLVRVLFSGALAALLLAVAAYLVFVPPASLSKRLLGLYLALLAFGELTILEILLGSAEQAARAVWLAARADIAVLRNLALVAFLWSYPRPPPLRSLHTAAFAGVALLYALGGLLLLGARDAIAGGVQPVAFLHDVAIRGGFFLGPALLLASALWRAGAQPAREATASFTLLALVVAADFTNRGVGLHNAMAALIVGSQGFPRFWAARWAWPGDCCHLAFALTAAAELVGFGLLAWLWLRRGHLVAPALAAYGFLVLFLPPPPINLFSQNYVFAALGPLYVAQRHRALGPPQAGPWTHGALAAGTSVVVFLLVTTSALWIFPDSTLGLVVGIFLGLVGCIGAALAVLPGGIPRWLGLAPGDDEGTRRSVVAYRSALQAEIAAGQQGEAIRAKLRELRAHLGISEREHAVMEHTLRASAAASGGSSVALEPGRRFLDRYSVVRVLGEGGAATTYLCRDDQVGREVVLKRLLAPGRGGLDAVLREARAVGAIQHPNVVTLHDVERVGDEAFIVMEHAQGGSLAARIAGGPLQAAEFRSVALDLLQGLEAVHAARLVHRDIKPSNVLLTAGGRAKLADFGVAHIRGFETTFVPGDQGAVGTVRFMSPEQARGKPCTERSDLFSAGATLYEAYTGRPYLEARRGESAVELQLRAAQGSPFRGRGLPGLPPGMAAWFARCLDPDPAARFGDAAAMRRALDNALGAERRRR